MLLSQNIHPNVAEECGIFTLGPFPLQFKYHDLKCLEFQKWHGHRISAFINLPAGIRIRKTEKYRRLGTFTMHNVLLGSRLKYQGFQEQVVIIV